MNNPTTAPNPERLRELLARATPGKWVVSGECDYTIITDDDQIHRSHVAGCVEPDDAKLIVAMHEALPALLHQLAEREAKLAELRQACWDARALLGFDNDGDPTPDALVYPSLADLVRRDAAEVRKDYDEACNEAHAAERAREEACKIIAELRDYVVNERDAQVLPRKAASYQRELDSIDAFLAASGGANNPTGERNDL